MITCIISYKSEDVLKTMDEVHEIENKIDDTMIRITNFRQVLRTMQHNVIYKSFIIPVLKRRQVNLKRVQYLVYCYILLL